MCWTDCLPPAVEGPSGAESSTLKPPPSVSAPTSMLKSSAKPIARWANWVCFSSAIRLIRRPYAILLYKTVMPNRLCEETSPYLRQHADNPVDWRPWSEAALAEARAQDRPILLSIGYSACHWCHVMA